MDFLMTVMQQSSKASDRTLGDWFNYIQLGQIKLPRFQRLEAWGRKSVTSFLDTIINNLPVGVTLVLDVAGKEQFESRYVSTADPRSARHRHSAPARRSAASDRVLEIDAQQL
jgi:hypothetical protein